MKYSNRVRGIALEIMIASLPFGLHSQGLLITPGLQFIVKGSPKLVLNNASLINNGRFIADSSTVLFTGTASTSNAFIGGDNPISFYNVAISKSSNDVQLNNNTTITGSVTMNSGSLLLNNYNLDLGSTGNIAGERNNSCITGTGGGTIRITALLNAPQAVNPGNIGVELTSEANLGLTIVTRGHVQQTNSNGKFSIQRYFDIVPSENRALNTTLRFYYLDGELAGKNKNELTLFSSSEGQSYWTSWGNDQTDMAINWVGKSNIDQLHRFTLANYEKNIITQPHARASVQIYPNPAHDVFTIVLVSEKEMNTGINFYDQLGHLLQHQEVYCQAGVNHIEWNTSKYAAGIYYMAFQDPDLGNLKIVKL
jgi:hypothetical protein